MQQVARQVEPVRRDDPDAEFIGQPGFQCAPHVAFHEAAHVVLVLEEERSIQRAEAGHETACLGEGAQKDVLRAEGHRLHLLLPGAELAVRIDLDLDPPARFLTDLLGEVLEFLGRDHRGHTDGACRECDVLRQSGRHRQRRGGRRPGEMQSESIVNHLVLPVYPVLMIEQQTILFVL